MHIKARWLRFWHCLFYTFTWKPHMAVTAWEKNTSRVVYIGCQCGKAYYFSE